MRRRILPALLAALLCTGVACKDGEIPDNPGDGGGAGSESLSLLQTTISPSPGDPVVFEATVTVDGTPQSNVSVTFSTENPPLTTEIFAPNPAQTNFQGTATTTLSTGINTPTFFSVRATTPTASMDVVNVTLQP